MTKQNTTTKLHFGCNNYQSSLLTTKYGVWLFGWSPIFAPPTKKLNLWLPRPTPFRGGGSHRGKVWLVSPFLRGAENQPKSVVHKKKFGWLVDSPPTKLLTFFMCEIQPEKKFGRLVDSPPTKLLFGTNILSKGRGWISYAG